MVTNWQKYYDLTVTFILRQFHHIQYMNSVRQWAEEQPGEDYSISLFLCFPFYQYTILTKDLRSFHSMSDHISMGSETFYSGTLSV